MWNAALTRCTFVCVQPIADAEASWEINYPGNVIQFLCLIYHSYTQDPVWHCPEFLKTLAMVAFHSGAPKGGSEGLLSPEGPAVAEGKGCVDSSSLPLLPHPAKKQVWDFIGILLMDSLLNIPANKQGHPLELLLEVSVVVLRLCCSALLWGWKDKRYPASSLAKG